MTKLSLKEIHLIYDLCGIIKKHNNDIELEVDIDFNNLVHIYSDDYSVEFRYVVFYGYITVSRIQFRNRNSWCMTECFNELLRYSGGWYDKIIVQAVSTYAMYSWCKKFGLNISEATEPMEFKDGDNVFPYGDYVRKI